MHAVDRSSLPLKHPGARDYRTTRHRALRWRSGSRRRYLRRAVLCGSADHRVHPRGHGIELPSERRDPASDHRHCPAGCPVGLLAKSARSWFAGTAHARDRGFSRARRRSRLPAWSNRQAIHGHWNGAAAWRDRVECSPSPSVRCSRAAHAPRRVTSVLRDGGAHLSGGSRIRSSGFPPMSCSGRYTRCVAGSTATVCACGARYSPSDVSFPSRSPNTASVPDSHAI